LNTLQVSYPRLLALVEDFTSADVIPISWFQSDDIQDAKLREAVAADEKSRWKRISAMVGKSEVGCKKRAKEMKITV